MKYINIFYLLLVLCVFVSCGDGDNNAIHYESPVFDTSFEILDKAGQAKTVFNHSEPVSFKINITNLTDKSQEMQFSSGQFYDINIFDSSENLLWQWSYDLYFTQDTPLLNFKPNETKSFTETWDQNLNNGDIADIGIYIVFVHSTGCGEDLVVPGYIEIKPVK